MKRWYTLEFKDASYKKCVQCFNFQVSEDQTKMTENNMVKMGEKPIHPLGFLKWTI